MTVDIVEETDENGKITERVVPSSEVTEPVVPTNRKDPATPSDRHGATAALEKGGQRVNTDETPHPDYEKGRDS